jgi:hypothetical protein
MGDIAQPPHSDSAPASTGPTYGLAVLPSTPEESHIGREDRGCLPEHHASSNRRSPWCS